MSVEQPGPATPLHFLAACAAAFGCDAVDAFAVPVETEDGVCCVVVLLFP
jgi:hypothetical protein